MRLKKLYLHGFKSFADKVEIDFEHGVTGVVGPNGCGKSNISDAVRWVLGEQNARSLRGTRMEDVIFSGTEKRRRSGYCEVTLIFDNEDHALPVDYTEVSVTRRAFRTGDSEYQLNGTDCRLKDIVDLFRDTGIGRDGYSVIGQGRVDEILSQKTEERRQVFEEAAGIVKYKTRKQEAEKRLDNTRQNLDRVNDIITTLEDRIEPLRLQSEDARRYLALRDELKGLELNAFLLRSERYNERIVEVRQATEDVDGEIARNEASREEAAQKRDASQEELAAGENETAVLRESLQQLIGTVEAGEGEAAVLRERIRAGENENDRIEAEKTAALQGESGLEARIRELEVSLAQEKAALEEKRLASAEADRGVTEADEKLAALEQKAEEAKENVINAMNSLGDVRSEQARLSALSQAIEGQLTALSAAGSSDEEKLTELRNALSEAQELYATEKERMNVLDNDRRECEEKTRRAGEEFESLTRELNTLLAEKQELSSRAKLLGELQRDYDGYNMSVKQVLREAQRRGGAGVHGVVANVIHAEEKIEKAVETALGAALQNVITDTEQDAQKMIDFLKENRYGRATFLPLSAVHGRTLDQNERRVLSMPGCIGVASEMVTFDSEYRGIVDSLLGRTVIARDLTSGIPIHRAGRQQFRLVTLDGDVMNVGGSMTGGSSQSRMSSLLSREREIKETGEKLQALAQKIASAQQKLTEVGESRARLKADRQEAYDALHQQEIAVTRAESHVSRAEEELSSAAKRADDVKNAITNLTEQLNENRAAAERLTASKSDNENSARLMREEAARLQTELNEARPGVNALRDAAAQLKSELVAAEKDCQMHGDELGRLNTRKGDTARLLAEAEEKLAELARRLEADRAELRQKEETLGLSRAGLEAARADFNAADTRRLDAQQRLKNTNEQLDALTKEAEELSERKHRCDLLLQRVQSDLDNLTARIWEDYQLTYEGAASFRDESFKLSEGEKRINTIRAEIKSLGSVNVGAVDEYREVSQRYEELSAQRDDLEKAQEDLQGIIDELAAKMEKQFKSQFDMLAVYFKETFSVLFGGGSASLSLEDPAHPLTSGIAIEAQPPGKKLQLLSLLSGGERALTAIAILFAMLKLKPTPFCILDEIEAALDDANIDNFAEYLKMYSEKTQFVVVTHRKGTMARCNALYGVAMEEKGVSKLMSVELSDAV